MLSALLLRLAGTNMGLRLSMLHNHSSTNDRNENQAVKEFAKGQGGPSARYEAAMQGPFPVYSVTEDYALSLELKKAGVKVSTAQKRGADHV